MSEIIELNIQEQTLINIDTRQLLKHNMQISRVGHLKSVVLYVNCSAHDLYVLLTLVYYVFC